MTVPRNPRRCDHLARGRVPGRRPVRALLIPAAIVALLCVPARAQQTPASPAETEALAFCTAWQLAAKAIELAGGLQAAATERIERARTMARECSADPQCSREQRITLEQEVRDAGYQQVRAAGLAAQMEQRKANLRTQFEELRGAGAAEKCNAG